MSNPLPASLPTPPTSDGDIQTFREYAAARGQLDPNLAPAPPTLPSKSFAETYEQYQAKLGNPANQQVNTTPPQKMNKSDQ